jgi:general stress protein CsbA
VANLSLCSKSFVWFPECDNFVDQRIRNTEWLICLYAVSLVFGSLNVTTLWIKTFRITEWLTCLYAIGLLFGSLNVATLWIKTFRITEWLICLFAVCLWFGSLNVTTFRLTHLALLSG